MKITNFIFGYKKAIGQGYQYMDFEKDYFLQGSY